MGWTAAEFDRLVAEHGAALYRVAFRLIGEANEAEDIVQETFRSAWESRNHYHPPADTVDEPESEETKPRLSPRGWLLTILRRRAADRWRRRWLTTCREAPPEPSFTPPDPSQDEFSDEMQDALRRLSRELVEALLLVVVGELTHQEASDVLGVPLGTVLSRVSRARTQLRETLLATRKP